MRLSDSATARVSARFAIGVLRVLVQQYFADPFLSGVRRYFGNAEVSAFAVLARLRHLARLRDAADFFPGRSYLK